MSLSTSLAPWLLWAQQQTSWWDEMIWGATHRQWIIWGAWLLLAFLGAFPLIVAYMVWAERKVAGRFQDRIGPNRVGPFGLLQPIADALKLITKENIVPRAADGPVHLLAPVILMVSAFLVLAVIPIGFGTLDESGRLTGLVAVDLPAGLLYLVAVASLSSLGVFLAGWSSRNKFSLLGAMRGVAQLVSYEVPQVLSLVPVILWAGSLSLVTIIDRQADAGLWYVFNPPGFLGFVLLTIASLAEVNRAPFDLPEAESEIVAGYHTEYSGMRFGLFFLAEYLSIFGVSCLAVTLFLGGGSLPFVGVPKSWLSDSTTSLVLVNLLSIGIFLLKVFLYIFLVFWIRATLPRLRVDQLMNFAWKYLIPLSLLNLVFATVWYEFTYRRGLTWSWAGWIVTALLVLGGAAVLLRLNLGLRPGRHGIPAARVPAAAPVTPR